MVVCAVCGASLSEDATTCPQCGRSAVGAAPGHLSRMAIAGRAGATEYAAHGPTFVPAVPTSPRPAVNGAGWSAGSSARSQTTPDYDPDATTKFTVAYPSRKDVKNTVALVGLALALVAAVSSLAWLIGQSMTAGRTTDARSAGSASPSATPISTVVPKNATVCTPEVARSTNTTCTLANRVLSAVRTLGTDLPSSFRVTVVNPQTTKNATYVCSIKSWIECVGSGDVTIYVMRQV